ncbi:MAG: hypothetical protein RLP44_09680 [Aggregatilineales bacterium]
MKLKINDQAPEVTLLDEHGASVELESLWSNGPTVLSFLRHFG